MEKRKNRYVIKTMRVKERNLECLYIFYLKFCKPFNMKKTKKRDKNMYAIGILG